MNLFDHKFIILGTYGANVLGQIRSLGEKGIKPIVVLVYKNTFRIDKSKFISRLYDVDTIEEGMNLILSRYGNESSKPFLYTDRDDVMGLFDSKYDILKDKFYIWNAGKQGRLNVYLSKSAQLELAEKCGMRIPKTEVVEVGNLPQKLSYPIFTKSIDSLNPYWKGNSYICYNEDDLMNAYSKMEVKKIMLQEYITKQDENPIEGISLNGGEVVKLFVKSINYRLTKDSFGIYRHLVKFDDTALESKIKEYIREIHYTGVFEIEFIIDKNGYAYFLETNFRITQYNWGYTLFGVNFPYIYAKSVLDGRIAEEDMKYSNKMPFNVMSEFEDFKYSVLKRKVTIFKWIKDVYRVDAFSFYYGKDKKPFYYTVISKCLNIFRH